MRWLAAVCGALLLGVAAAVLYLFTADLGHFREEVAGMLSDALGREVRIDGPLSLRLGQTVRVSADGVSLANSTWADGPFLLQADRLTAEVPLASLFSGPLRVDQAELSGATIDLQESEDGRWNWRGLGSSDPSAPTAAPPAGSLPRVGAFTARMVTVRVSSPALTADTEVAIDAATFTAGSKSLTLQMTARLNDFPVTIEAVSAPNSSSAAADAVDVKIDAEVGEVMLKVVAEAVDPDTLALETASMTLDGPDAGYLFSVLNLPRITSGALDLKATLEPDPGRSGFSASGHLGDYRLAADGWFEDLRGTGGFDLNFELGGRDLGALGESLAYPGLPRDAFSVDGRFRSIAGGVALDDATVTLGEETIESQGQSVRLDDGRSQTTLALQHPDISGEITAVTEETLTMASAELTFKLEGADARAAGRRIGWSSPPPGAFVISGDGAYEAGVLAFYPTRVEVGQQQFLVTGELDVSTSDLTADLQLTAKNVNPFPWLGPEIPSLPLLESLSGTGGLRYAAGVLQMHSLSMTAGELSVTGAVNIPFNDTPPGLQLQVSGPDAAQAGLAMDVAGLPAGPFTVAGSGNYNNQTLSIDTGKVLLGEQRIEGSGQVNFGEKPAEVNLQLSAQDLDLLSWFGGLEKLAAPFRNLQGTGQLQLADNWLTLASLSLQAQDKLIEGSVALDLNRDGDWGRFDLVLEAPSAASLQPSLEPYFWASEPIRLQGRGSWQPSGWKISEGALGLSGRGTLRGSLALTDGEPPLLTAKLTSESLDLRDQSKSQEDEDPADWPDGKVIPQATLELGWLQLADAEFDLSVTSLYSPITAGASFKLGGTLRNGSLTLSELEANGRRGRLQAELTATPDDQAYRLSAALNGEDLYLAGNDEAEFALAEQPSYTLNAELEGMGADLRAIAGSLSGRFAVQASPGRIVRRGGMLSRLVFEDFLTRTLESINPLVRERKTVQLTCLVLSMDFEDGTARGDPMLALQTPEVDLLARGQIDFATEVLDLDIVAQPRKGLGISIGDLLNPFTKVGGTLADPRIVADPTTGAIETGVGIATGGLWPLGKKLLQRFGGGTTCAAAMTAEQDAEGR